MGAPLKRSPYLVLLSRDHHEGLLICWKIREGIALGIAQERLRSFLVTVFPRKIFPHFSLEEQFLLPLLQPENPMRVRVEQEHLAMRQMLANLEEQSAKGYGAQEALIDALDRHIRFEEREFFPYLESNLPARQLEQVARTLEPHHTPGEFPWNDPFWVRNKG